jgi:uncharacterized protein involved in outer membrane biogenesis
MIFARMDPWRKRTAIALAALLAAAAIVAAFDWNWLRGALERHLAKESGREVRIGALDVQFGFSLAPTVRLNDVFIENAPWAASKKPFVVAREVAIVIPVSALFRRPIVVPRIVVNDGQIDMERRADGLRNWRLRNPEDRSSGRVRVQTLESRRSSLQFANEEIGLEFFASTSDADATPDLPSRIQFKGRYKGRDFTGDGLIGRVISFRESGVTFAVRGHIDATGTRLEVDGTASDIFEPRSIDVRARLAGTSLSDVYPFVRIRPPRSRPYWLQTRITHRDRVFRFEHIVGKLGGTPGTAEASYDRSGDRPQVTARLHSDAAEFGDVSPLIGLASPGLPPPPRAAKEPAKGDDGATAGRPLPVEALRALDVKVIATAKQLAIAGVAKLENPRVEAVLRDGLLEAQPVTFRVAGGEGTAAVTLDVRQASASATVTAALRGVQLERLMRSVADEHRVSARMNVSLNLAGQGKSAREISSRASGNFETRIESGSISNRVDAKLGLNFGKLLRLFIQGDRDIAINCGRLAVDVRGGIGTTRTLALDTAQTRVAGKGTLSLRDQRIDLVLTPEPKNPGLFTRRASIIVRGPLSAPDVSLGERVELAFTSCSPAAPAARQ